MSIIVKLYRVFIASPGGLESERKAFRETIYSFNDTEAPFKGVYFAPVGWEIAGPAMGRPQEAINTLIEQSDYMVILLWDRWGSPSFPVDTKIMSAIEEEYALGVGCCKNPDLPMKEVVVLFRAVDPVLLARPDEQLKKFWRLDDS